MKMKVRLVLLSIAAFSLSGCQYFRDKDSYVEGKYREAKETSMMSWPRGLNSAKFSDEYNIPKVGSNLKNQSDNPYPPSLA